MSSYREIAKSSGIIGIVQIVKIIFGLIQNKVLALIVGTAGFGMWGMYNTYIEMVSSFSSLGLDASGVRQIAKNSDDAISVSKCIWIFKRSLFWISLLATFLSILFARSISLSLFKTEQYYGGVVVVSFVIFLNGISKGNIAILNGLRHIKYLAFSQIIGAIVGAVIAIISVILLGFEGIPVFLIAIGLTAVCSTWWYVRKIKIKSVRPTTLEIRSELRSLITMGLGFSVSGAIAALMTYLSRVYLMSEFDVNAVGIYQASWTISNLYIGTILTAMGVDFMPRLMKILENKIDLNKMVTEQLEFGILVSSIGVLGILIYSPLVLHLFYSNEFIVGTPIIRWQVLGVAMRVLGFVFGFVIMAHNKPFVFVMTQTFVAVADYLFLILFAEIFGFSGLGMNYFVSYLFYVLLICPFCCKMFHIKISKKVWLFLVVEWVFIALVCLLIFVFDEKYMIFIGCFILLFYSMWMYYAFVNYLNINLIQILKTKIRNQ